MKKKTSARRLEKNHSRLMHGLYRRDSSPPQDLPQEVPDPSEVSGVFRNSPGLSCGSGEGAEACP
eukprot:4683381-Alexandrium_andersonii.AAC.1